MREKERKKEKAEQFVLEHKMWDKLFTVVKSVPYFV